MGGTRLPGNDCPNSLARGAQVLSCGRYSLPCRLFVSGFPPIADRWHQDYAIAGVTELCTISVVQWRGWMAAPRCTTDVIEGCSRTRCDLFASTGCSWTFEGASGQTPGATARTFRICGR